MDSSECRALWGQMITGRCKILGTFTAGERSNLVFAEGEPIREPLSGRRLQVLERILSGSSGKAIAIDLGITQSTVTLEARRALAALGYVGSTSRVPFALAILFHAAHANRPAAIERARELDADGQWCEVLRAPISRLLQGLPPAVCEVVRMHAQGISHAEIAARRHTSTRTVANQLATAFQRLGVSGRSGLLSYLAAHEQAS